MNKQHNSETRKVLEALNEKGWALVPEVYSKSSVATIIEEFYQYEKIFLDIQEKSGIADKVIDTTHHTPILCRKMLSILESNKVSPILDAFFDGKYILNTMGLSKIKPNGKLYTQDIHRDVRSFHGAEKLWMNTLVMLDDSTLDNGATWVLEGSEHSVEKPGKDYFFEHAKRVEGKAGDVMLFNGHLWHCAGENSTDKTRHIITPFYTKAFIKQQFDYPRAFGPDFGNICSSHLKQVLGYNALTPTTLDEFYQKDEDRFYKSDQG